MFALLKFGSLRGSTSASLKIGEILAVCKNLFFETRGLTHVTLLIVTVCLLAPRLRALAKRVNPLICQVVYRANHKCKYFSTTFSSTNQIVRTLPAQRHPMHTSWRHSAFITWLTTSKWAINKRLTTESVAGIVVLKSVDKITAFNRKMIICCLHWVFFMMSAQSSGLLPPDEVKMSCKSDNIPVWVWLWNWPLLTSFCSVGRFTHICRSLGSVAWKIPNSLQQYCFGVCFRGICQVIVPFCHKIEKS